MDERDENVLQTYISLLQGFGDDQADAVTRLPTGSQVITSCARPEVRLNGIT